MNSTLESGLFLPIRFYGTLAEQDRYKTLSVGVGLLDENYIYADCKTLVPFQVVFSQVDVNISISWKLICVDSLEETSMPYTAACWEEYVDVDQQMIWTSYLGTDDFTGTVDNGKYYIVLTIKDAQGVDRVYYSDIFIIRNCSTTYDVDDYRITTPSNDDKRLINTSDLRITKV